MCSEFLGGMVSKQSDIFMASAVLGYCVIYGGDEDEDEMGIPGGHHLFCASGLIDEGLVSGGQSE